MTKLVITVLLILAASALSAAFAANQYDQYKMDLEKAEKIIEEHRAEYEKNKALLANYLPRADAARHKMDIYNHAYVIQDFDEINQILDNGHRTIPSDISDNIYYAWPYTNLPNGLFTDENTLMMNTGNVYLATATVIDEIENHLYLVEIYGNQAEALFKEELPSIGETVNIYFSPFAMRKSQKPLIYVGESEKEIDSFHSLYIKEKHSL